MVQCGSQHKKHDLVSAKTDIYYLQDGFHTPDQKIRIQLVVWGNKNNLLLYRRSGNFCTRKALMLKSQGLT